MGDSTGEVGGAEGGANGDLSPPVSPHPPLPVESPRGEAAVIAPVTSGVMGSAALAGRALSLRMSLWPAEDPSRLMEAGHG